MPIPKFITFTGIDDHTDLDRVAELSKKYPIEWGILFGGRVGRSRYPSVKTITAACSLARVSRMTWDGVKFSAHLCGHYAQSVLKTGQAPFLLDAFQRVQINSRNYPYAQIIQLNIGKPIVLQCRGAFPLPMNNEFTWQHQYTWLHDESGGKGRISANRPVQPEHYSMVGYAGGIKPDNVIDIINSINAYDFYIDMESGVRTDDWLDLDKCESICKLVYK